MSRTLFHAPHVQRTAAAALILGALLAGAAALPRAHAATDDAQKCEQASGITAIAACSRAIDSGHYHGHDLAELHGNRAVAHRATRDFDGSIMHFNIAIRLDPEFAAAFFGRGNTWQAKGELDRAITDFNEA